MKSRKSILNFFLLVMAVNEKIIRLKNSINCIKYIFKIHGSPTQCPTHVYPLNYMFTLNGWNKIHAYLKISASRYTCSIVVTSPLGIKSYMSTLKNSYGKMSQNVMNYRGLCQKSKCGGFFGLARWEISRDWIQQT